MGKTMYFVQTRAVFDVSLIRKPWEIEAIRNKPSFFMILDNFFKLLSLPVKKIVQKNALCFKLLQMF